MAEANNTPQPLRPSTYMDLGPYHCRLSFAKYSRPKPFDNAKLETEKVIVLPLPMELMDTTSVDYTTKELETVGDILNMNITSGAGALALRVAGEQISTGAGDVMGAISSQLGADSSFAQGVSQEVRQQILPPDKITSALQASMGLAPNPNLVVNFQGPKLREFSFSWTFYPHSEIESGNIKMAIEEIRKRSLPYSAGGTSAGVLGYPNMVQMNFYPWDNLGESPNAYGWTEQSIIRMKKCVIDRVAVNYAPNNVPAFFQGGQAAPVAIRLELSLREIEYMMAEDYMDGVFTREGGVAGTEAGAARDSVWGRYTLAVGAGGAYIGSVGGTAGAVVGGVLGGAVAAGKQGWDYLTRPGEPVQADAGGRTGQAGPAGTVQQVQPQATPNPVQEAVSQSNGGR